MRKVLAITVALMIAAMVFSPALGYTNRAAGNQSYTVTSGARVNYSIGMGVPSHNLTPDMVTDKYSFTASGVQSTRVPYSFNVGGKVAYSAKALEVSTGAQPVSLDVNVKPAETPAATVPAVTTEAANVTLPIVEEPVMAVNATEKADNATTEAPLAGENVTAAAVNATTEVLSAAENVAAAAVNATTEVLSAAKNATEAAVNATEVLSAANNTTIKAVNATELLLAANNTTIEA
jgi:hypothetical protein